MKNRMKQLGLVSIFSFAILPAQAQGSMSGFFTDGFLYRHQMNPALGNDSTTYISIPVIGNVNARMYGNFGLQDVLFDNPRYPDASNKKKTTFLSPYIENGLDGFSKGSNRVGADVKVGLLSAGWKGMGGYNTFDVNLRATADVKIPYEFLAFAKDTGNKDYDMGDLDAEATSYVEIALGHSHQVSDRWKVGGKLKFLLGLGNARLQMHNMKATLSDNQKWEISGDAVADVSIKGFEYKSKYKQYNSRDEQYSYVNDVKVSGYGISGFGMAADFGAEYKAGDRWNLSAALLDFGFISWSNDIQAKNISNHVTFDGFHDLTVGGDSDNPMDKPADEYADQFMDFAHLTSLGDQGKRTTMLGATLNLAASYKACDWFKAGLLSSTRLHGSFSWTEARLSGNFMPLSWVDGNVNVAVGTFGHSIGWLLNFHPMGFNFFIGMDHVLGKLSKEGIPLNSNVQLSTGFNIQF